MQFIDVKAQYHYLKQKIDARIEQVITHAKFISGPEVEELEEKLADYVGVKHAITCGNGTDALQLCMMTLDIGPGDVVFCPTFTFFATAEVIAQAGATPVFVDSDANTFNICPVDLESKINQVLKQDKQKPKAIIAVDLFGLPANYPKLNQIADKYELTLIEDAAQGFGGEISGKRAGSLADLATTSFFPAKPLGCYGDGGAIFTDNDDYAELIRSFCVHGKGQDKYDNVRIGMNSRLDTIQAAILLEKLAVFPQELAQRSHWAAQYAEMLPANLNLPSVPAEYKSAWALYTLQSEEREHYMAKLKAAGVPTMIYYSKCMHLQSAFSHQGHMVGDFPVAEKLASQVFSIPMHPYLETSDIEKVISVLASS